MLQPLDSLEVLLLLLPVLLSIHLRIETVPPLPGESLSLPLFLVALPQSLSFHVKEQHRDEEMSDMKKKNTKKKKKKKRRTMRMNKLRQKKKTEQQYF